jgi:hypothetical protein
MKNPIINLTTFLIFSFFTSCMTTTKIARYTITPDKNENLDSTIVILPNLGRVDGFCFTLNNVTNEPIFINWDKSFLLINGITYRCIHSGIRFIEKSTAQTITPIGPHSILSDCLFPSDNIYMNNVYEGWLQKPLQANEGRYFISILRNSNESTLQGNFTMTIDEQKVPMNNMSATNASNNALIYISCSLVIIASFIMIF